MLRVGYRIRLSSGKGPDREGVVTAVMGSLVRVLWPSQVETTVVPAPGTVTVLAPSDESAPPVGSAEETTREQTTAEDVPEVEAPATSTSTKKATAKKTTSKATTTKAPATKQAAKETAATNALATKTTAKRRAR